MILGDLLDAPVVDSSGRVLGFVVDVRLVLDGPVDGLLAAPRVHGLLVSPRTGTSFLGYERTGLDAPALLARFLRWRHRGSFLVHWTDVEVASADGVRLADGYRRWSPAIPGVAHQRP
ncbi:hypothetical protein Cch01nite_36650 [Cellulomonas chitinilytica]|uniref:PRC-barrel domain-containing protein n=1 Tax=Cellulomonas chitinilytica TaxID=398759 RepID=A0A919U345_9CELL|nr:PRC-barrel domain containing protein [Cellulomonas chitinilytica]GIG22941.1 hypothetical protein Cch01nite_36650 [Cellulomonas chitinilytica]